MCYYDENEKEARYMKTIVILFSKTGNSKKVAESVVKELGCDIAELTFDETTKTITGDVDPSGYERVVLVCPIWAFSLPEPMKLYLQKHGKAIKNYSLIVTYSMFGLRGCIGNCVSAIGKAPQKTMKIKSNKAQSGDFDVKPVI